MELDKTLYNTAKGLYAFSHILDSALLEAAKSVLHNKEVFESQYALHADSISPELGHTYYGRYLGKIGSNATQLWIGLDMLTTNVRIVFTIIIDENDAASVQWLNKVRQTVQSNQNLCDPVRQPPNSQKGFYIGLEQGKCNDVCSVLKPEHDKIKIIFDFIMDIDMDIDKVI